MNKWDFLKYYIQYLITADHAVYLAAEFPELTR